MSTENLAVEQSVLKITPSLSILLQQLRSRDDVRFVWIDQICINQQDGLEKAVQVKMMGEIYVSAQKVFVWLGPSTTGSDLAMDRIPLLDDTIGVLPESQFARDVIPSRLPGEDDPLWPGLADLYTRSWYDRLWVLQEVILAREIEVLCGNKFMQWALFASFATKLYELWPHAWVRAFDTKSHSSNDSTQGQTCGLVSVRDIETMRVSEADGNKPPFWTYLSMGQKCKVTRPLDRVYGLLGLLVNKDLVQSLDVRYDWELWQGYLDFCKLYIEQDPDLSLLSMAGCVTKPKESPTWCPNFNSQPNVASIYCNYPSFRAGFKSGEIRRSRIQTFASSKTILVPGFRMDKVSAVTEAVSPLQNSTEPWGGPTGQAAKHGEFHLECLNLFEQVYPAKNKDLQSFFRSLVAGHLTRLEPLPAIGFSTVHLRLLEMWDAMTTGGEMPRSSERELVIIKKWLSALSMQAFRRFFITEAGRVGLGSGGVKKGDHVCVFYSAGPLYLLRYDDPDSPAELIGDTYVDGLMELEKTPIDTLGNDEIFVIK